VANDAPVRGRILDLEGQPVSGAHVTVRAIQTTTSGTLDAVFALWQTDPSRALQQATKGMRFTACAGLPAMVVADKEGRFEVNGVGSGRLLTLLFEAKGIETAAARVVTIPGFDPNSVRPKPGMKNMNKSARIAPHLYGPEFTHIAKPDAVIKGVVTDAKTGKPIAGVQVTGSTEQGWWENSAIAKTDVDGRYRLGGVANAPGRRLQVWPGDKPYLSAGQVVNDVPGLSETTVDVRLARGVLVDGRVTDKATGKPIQGAAIRYTPLSGNPYFAKTPGTDIYKMASESFISDANGVFHMKVLPGVGLILAQGETRGATIHIQYTQVRVDPADEPRLVKEVRAALGDTFLTAADNLQSLRGQSAYKIIDPPEGSESLKLELQFDPGRSVSGKVVDADGKPATGIVAHGLTAAFSGAELLKDGAFTALGLDPSHPRTVVFADAARKLSGAVRLGGDEKAPPIVKLQNWAAVTGRVVDTDGNPCPGVRVSHGVAEVDVYAYYRMAVREIEAITGMDGAFRLDIPLGGIEFRLAFQRKGQILEATNASDALKVLPGETKHLGDITIKSD
jgi:hypothetical protein